MTLGAGDMLVTLVAVFNTTVGDTVGLSLAEEEGELETLTDPLVNAVVVEQIELTAVAEEVHDARLVNESALVADISDEILALSESREETVVRALSIDEADDVTKSVEMIDAVGETVCFADVLGGIVNRPEVVPMTVFVGETVHCAVFDSNSDVRGDTESDGNEELVAVDEGLDVGIELNDAVAVSVKETSEETLKTLEKLACVLTEEVNEGIDAVTAALSHADLEIMPDKVARALADCEDDDLVLIEGFPVDDCEDVRRPDAVTIVLKVTEKED